MRWNFGSVFLRFALLKSPVTINVASGYLVSSVVPWEPLSCRLEGEYTRPWQWPKRTEVKRSPFDSEVFPIGRTKGHELLYVTTITPWLVNYEIQSSAFLLPREIFLPVRTMYREPHWLYRWGQYIRKEPWFCETEYFTVPDVSLEGDPRPEFVYFILCTKTPIPLLGAAPGMTRNASGGTNKLSNLVKSHFWS